VVSLLLEKNAYPDARDEEAGTPLSRAVQERHRKVVRLLVEGGADPFSDEYATDELPPLVLAADRDEVEMVELFLGKEAESKEEKNHHVWSALVTAYEEGYDRVVKLLLNQGDPFKGMKGEILRDRLWDITGTGPGNKQVEQLLQPYIPDNWKEIPES
jgi:ankyrin repeat protein